MRIQHPIEVAGLSLIVLQVSLRATAAYQGWFYGDDFEFLQQATNHQVSLSYLMRPHDSQLMPAGILAAWVVAHAGPFNWPLATTVILVLQVLASTACWLMLREIFGLRWRCLGLLSVYLFSTLTLTAFMWWSAAINQVPLQLASFTAFTLHVRYLRTQRLRFAVLATAALGFGLLFYVKALLIVIPLTLITFWYFTEQHTPLRGRLRRMAVDHWPAWSLYGAVTAGYLQYYVRSVPNPIAAANAIPYGELLDKLFRSSLGPGLLGGPWRWSENNPPLGLVATPEWAVTAAWVVLAVGLVLARRERGLDWRAFGVLLPYLVVSFLLVARGRASLIGGNAGLEPRYLADSVPVIVLCAGLLFVGRRGLEQVPPASELPELRRPSRSTVVIAAAVVALLTGAALSNVQYMRFWTSEFPAKAYVQAAVRQSEQGPLRLVDEPVPPLVVPGTSFPANLPSRVFKPLGQARVRATTVGNDLDILNSSGTAVAATVTGARSLAGPLVDCGYGILGSPVDIDFSGSPPDYFWWLELFYSANVDGAVELKSGGVARRATVKAGPHRLFVQGEGLISDLTLRTLTPGLVLCATHVAVGDIAPVVLP